VPRVHCRSTELCAVSAVATYTLLCNAAPALQADAFRVLTTGCFSALAIVVAVSGVQMARLEPSAQMRFLIYEPRTLAAVNILLFAVFFSKSAYSLCSALAIYYLPNIPLQGDADISLLNFAVFFFWDYLPTILLLLVWGHRGSSTGSAQGAANSRAAHLAAGFVAGSYGSSSSSGGGGSSGRPLSTARSSSSHRPLLPQRQSKRPRLPDYGLFREIKMEALRIDSGGDRSHSPFDSTVLADPHFASAAGLEGSIGSSYGSASPSSVRSSGAGGLVGSWRSANCSRAALV
jgi:hypothetical protein